MQAPTGGDVIRIFKACADAGLSAREACGHLSKLSGGVTGGGRAVQGMSVAEICRGIEETKPQAPGGAGGFLAGGEPTDAESRSPIVRHCEQRAAGIDPMTAAQLKRIGEGGF